MLPSSSPVPDAVNRSDDAGTSEASRREVEEQDKRRSGNAALVYSREGPTQCRQSAVGRGVVAENKRRNEVPVDRGDRRAVTGCFLT